MKKQKNIWCPHVPYNPKSPQLFEKEKERIKKYLKTNDIYHFGSTSVPGLGGKGYIDIYITTNKNKFADTSKIIQEKLGYEYRDHVSITGERLFFKRTGKNNQRYNLHLTYFESSDFKNVMKFKENLLKNPEYIQKYEKLKKKASREANKQKTKKGAIYMYMKIKEDLIKKITSI